MSGERGHEFRAFLLDIVQFFAEKPERAILLLAQRDEGVAQQPFDRLLHLVGERCVGDARMHQRGDVAPCHGQVAEDLQDSDGLGDALANLVIAELLDCLFDRVVDGSEGPSDVLFQRVVERHRGRQPSDLPVGHGRQGTGTFDKDVLNDLDRRAKTEPAGRFGQGTEQVEQDIEMGRQERVEVGEVLLVETGAVKLRVGQLGVLPQRLPIAVELTPEFGRTG